MRPMPLKPAANSKAFIVRASPAVTLKPETSFEMAFVGYGLGTAAQTITVVSPYANDSGQQNPTTPAGLFSFVSASYLLPSIDSSAPSATATSEPWAVAAATFRCATEASFSNNLQTIAGNAVSTAASGVQKVGVVGNAGAAFDATVAAGSAPANMIVVGGQYNSTLPSPTTGQTLAIQLDAKGQALVDVNYWAGTALGTPSNFGTSPTAVVAGSVNASIFAGTTALTQTSGALDVNLKTSAATSVNVIGTLTNNNAAPSANLVGAMTALCGTNPPAWTSGDLTLLSVDTAGNLRVAVADEGSAVASFSADTGTSTVSVSTVKPVLSIEYNSATTKAVRLRAIEIMGDGDLCYYSLHKNATLTGASFVATSSALVTKDTSATSISGGSLVASGYIGSIPRYIDFVEAPMNIAQGQVGDIYTLQITGIGGSTVNVSASMRWTEIA